METVQQLILNKEDCLELYLNLFSGENIIQFCDKQHQEYFIKLERELTKICGE